MKRFLMTIALTCVFAASAIGGEIPSVPLTPPPPEDEVSTATSPGDVPSVGYTAGLNLIQLMVGTIV